MKGRFALRVACVLAVILVSASSAWCSQNCYSWIYGINCPSNWTCANANCSCVAGDFHIQPTTSDPQTLSPTLAFTPTSTDYIRTSIRSLNNNNQIEFFFSDGCHGFSGSNMKTYTVSTDGDFHYYTIPVSGSYPGEPQLAGVLGWSSCAGDITRLRIDPARSSVGSVDIEFVVLRHDANDPNTPVFDTIPPGTWINTPVTVTAHGDDPAPPSYSQCPGGTNPDYFASGVFDFAWSIDARGEHWQRYTDGTDGITGTARVTLAFPNALESLTTGHYRIHLRSRDRCGRNNPSNVATTDLYFDAVPPSVPSCSPNVTPSECSANNSFCFSWCAATDPGYPGDGSGVARYEYRIDGGAPNSVGGALSVCVAAPSAGDHTFEVRAVDGAGNPGSWGGQVAFHYANGYTITASAGTGGSITPGGTVGVVCASGPTFAIAPDACHQVADVVVDGASVGSVGSWTFPNVQTNHTISASFSLTTYGIDASAGAHGTIAPSGAVAIGCGTDASFTMTPDACFKVADVIVDGGSVGPIGAYTFPNVTGPHTITAAFAASGPFAIFASAGAHGTIGPSGIVAAECGSAHVFTIDPEDFYHIENLLVDGVAVDSLRDSTDTARSYRFDSVEDDHTIEAEFALGVLSVAERTPTKLWLGAALPNPARSGADIGFSLPREANAILAIHDLSGRGVVTLVSGWRGAGEHVVHWSGRDAAGVPVPNGLYFYRLEAGGGTTTRKLTVLH